MKSALLTTSLLLLLSTAAFAQTLEKKSLSLDGAKKVIAAAVAEAKRLNAPGGVIAVVDDGGNLNGARAIGQHLWRRGEYLHRQGPDGGLVQAAYKGIRRHHQERAYLNGRARELHAASGRSADHAGWTGDW